MPCQLVLGNEWKDDRPWRGALHRFAIYARFMDGGEALARQIR